MVIRTCPYCGIFYWVADPRNPTLCKCEGWLNARVKELEHKVAELEAKRDELIEALKDMMQAYPGNEFPTVMTNALQALKMK